MCLYLGSAFSFGPGLYGLILVNFLLILSFSLLINESEFACLNSA